MHHFVPSCCPTQHGIAIQRRRPEYAGCCVPRQVDAAYDRTSAGCVRRKLCSAHRHPHRDARLHTGPQIYCTPASARLHIPKRHIADLCPRPCQRRSSDRQHCIERLAGSDVGWRDLTCIAGHLHAHESWTWSRPRREVFAIPPKDVHTVSSGHCGCRTSFTDSHSHT